VPACDDEAVERDPIESREALTATQLLLERLDAHPLSEEQAGRLTQLRAAQADYAVELLRLTPHSREQALAITHFEQSCMWAAKSIALEKK